MILRPDQLNQIAIQATLSRISDIICTSYPDARPQLTSEAGRKILLQQAKEAESYGLASELDIARYSITAWLLGLDFDTRFPAMREVLSDSSLPPNQKADAIESFAVTLLETLQPGANK